MQEIKLLSDGISALCKSDENINRLIVPRRDEILLLLTRYIKEIVFFNDAYGLVGTNEKDELIIKHILDSLAPLGILSRLPEIEHNTAQIADAGSGAGLPGIPLAIAMPNHNFTLIERMGRRAGFLCSTAAILANNSRLSNITVEEGELEKTKKGHFNLITFRAFKPLDSKLLKALSGAITENGIIAAYKGQLEKIKLEMSKLEKTNIQWEAIAYSVPFLEEERHLLVIRMK
ncbi:MAG: 16S rRNA (guanine(527)-N(7))-methyltransferase RsmG [Treponema sp.]|jgi:16S rRNA (guanine527-N7)-methyltransferase|nr:16S rRNA (guanine(527)-N(7))-methyltransferase RsmG [Treponema sp.]